MHGTCVITWFLCVSVLIGITCHIVVVLRNLCSTTAYQGQYDESLQMHRRLYDILMKVSPKSEEMATGRCCYEQMSGCHCYCYFLCTVCFNMGVCHMKLSQLDAAEKAFSQSMSIMSAIFPHGHGMISLSETTV